jgi:hypothetical protein
VDDDVIVGRYKHSVAISERLHFIYNLLALFKHELTNEQINGIWELTIMGALSAKEHALGFQWFITVLQLPSSMSRDSLYRLFSSVFPEIPSSSLCADAFKIFRFCFLSLNEQEGTLEFVSDFQNTASHRPLNFENDSLIVRTCNLIGIQMLWEITVKAIDTAVVDRALSFITALYRNCIRVPVTSGGVSGSLPDENVRDSFINSCLTMLRSAHVDLLKLSCFGAANTFKCESLKLQLDRCLKVLFNCVTEDSHYACCIPDFGKHLTHERSLQARGLMMELQINVLPNLNFPLQMDMHDTVGDLRHTISQKILAIQQLNSDFADSSKTLSAHCLRLIYAGKGLIKNSTPLRDVVQEGKVHLFSTQSIAYSLQTVYVSCKSARTHDTNDLKWQELCDTWNIFHEAKNFEMLFSLLEIDSTTVARHVWNLLMLLPSSDQKKNEILGDVQFTPPQPVITCASVLPLENAFKLLYSLQLIQAFVLSDSSVEYLSAETLSVQGDSPMTFSVATARACLISLMRQDFCAVLELGGLQDQSSMDLVNLGMDDISRAHAQWCAQFVTSGGFVHLVNTLFDANFLSDDFGPLSTRVSCLALTLQLICAFYYGSAPPPNTKGINENSGNCAWNILHRRSAIIHLMQIIRDIAGLKETNAVKDADHEIVVRSQTSAVHAAFSLLVHLSWRQEGMLLELAAIPDLDEWIVATVLLAQVESVRNATYIGLLHMTSKVHVLLSFQHNRLLGSISNILPHRLFL